jgi:hypothetical protein
VFAHNEKYLPENAMTRAFPDLVRSRVTVLGDADMRMGTDG